MRFLGVIGIVCAIFLFIAYSVLLVNEVPKKHYPPVWLIGNGDIIVKVK